MSNPYYDNKNIRTFSEEVDELDLIWHRDREDRKIVVESGKGWKLQKDNQLPIVMEQNKEYNIKAMEYHRIIKGRDNLVIRIFKEQNKYKQKQNISIPNGKLIHGRHK